MQKLSQNEIEIGKRIRECRLQKGIKQEDLAKMIGISQRKLCSIENGKGKFTVDLVMDAALAIGISVTEMMELENRVKREVLIKSVSDKE